MYGIVFIYPIQALLNYKKFKKKYIQAKLLNLFE